MAQPTTELTQDTEPEEERLGILAQSFIENGKPRNSEGNNPLLLDNPQSVWYVGSGVLEIFTTMVTDGECTGARSHFTSVPTGGLVFGMNLAAYGHQHGFVAAGSKGTVLYRLTLKDLQHAAQHKETGVELAGLLDGWVTSLSHGVTESIPRPQADVKLRAGAETIIPSSQRATARKNVVWVHAPDGHAIFIGMEDLYFDQSDFIFPITPESWLEFAAETRVLSWDTETLVDHSALWNGLEQLHAAICESEFINKTLLNIDEINRQRSKADHRQGALDDALRSIGSVLEEKRISRGYSEVASEDPLLAACELVGTALNIPVRPPADTRSGGLVEPLLLISKASRFRVRQIMLRGDWWNRDHGPFLGWTAETKQPVALIPRGCKAYDMVNPGEGTRVPVTEEVADTIEPFAETFYRSFKDGPMSVVDVVKFGSYGLNRDYITIAIMGVLVGMLGTLSPIFSGQIFDTVIPSAAKGQLLQYGVALFSAAIAVAAFSITRAIAVLRVEGKMDYSIQAALWDRLLNLPSTFFRSYAAGDLADRAAGVDAIRATTSGVGVTAVLGSVTSLFQLVVMFRINTNMALMATVLVFIAVALTAAANYAQLSHQRKQFSIRGRIAGRVLQFLTGVSKLRVAGAEDHAFKVWARDFSEQKRIAFVIGRIENFVAVFNAGYPVICSLVIFGTMVSVQASGTVELSTGDFIAFTTSFSMFLMAMLALSKASLSLLAVVPVYERIVPIITSEAEIDDERKHPGELTGEIDLYHVNFRYDEDGPLILQNVSLKIKPGEFVAFVGPSGSGKSTILRVLLGFETPESGNVYYDGQDLKTLDLREVRQQMGVVLQSSKLMPTDIFRNIIGPNARLTIDDAWEAAEMAGLADDVRGMPMGMHTVISEGGGAFSGGQKQRLMIARAIVTRPRILFFDEATSALDNRTQKMVSDSLDAMHATRIVIAHRLSTIINADRIVVLVAGRVEEEGTYEELMAKGGIFADLAKRQVA
ncbi:MAG: NHLP bacteriocin export ABC transporter permease/ATPase subunit [Verrucomicrobiales bacterium]